MMRKQRLIQNIADTRMLYRITSATLLRSNFNKFQ